MSCDCCKKEKALEKLMRLEPEKTSQLVAFIDSLPLGQDIDVNRGHLIETLHKAQGIFGYLPQEVQQVISERLKITRSEIYGVISFYSYFTDKPIGQTRSASAAALPALSKAQCGLSMNSKSSSMSRKARPRLT